MLKELSSKNFSFITESCILKDIDELNKILLKSIKAHLSENSIKIFGLTDIDLLQSSVSKQELFVPEKITNEVSITIKVPDKINQGYPMAIIYRLNIEKGSFAKHSLTVTSGYINFYEKRVQLDEFWKNFSSDPQDIQKPLDILLSSVLLYWIDKARNQK
jgi:hypothetical protein